MVKSLSLVVGRSPGALLYNGLQLPLPPYGQPDRAATGVGRASGDGEPDSDASRAAATCGCTDSASPRYSKRNLYSRLARVLHDSRKRTVVGSDETADGCEQ